MHLLLNCCREILALEKQLHMNNQKKMLLEKETEVCLGIVSLKVGHYFDFVQELERKLEEKKKILKQIIQEKVPQCWLKLIYPLVRILTYNAILPNDYLLQCFITIQMSVIVLQSVLKVASTDVLALSKNTAL